jgi:dTDP-glucose 4,6-dehydratase
MHLLITGGAGFIGSHLVKWAALQPEVQRLVNLDSLTYAGHLENLRDLPPHSSYHFEKVDLREQTAVSRVIQQHEITHIIHLAAESHVDRSIDAPDVFLQTNVLGTLHLLKACHTHWQGAVGNFLHVSTDEVYGTLGSTGSFTETAAHAPNSPYAASKSASDMLVRSYHRTYGLPTRITHGSNTYGPHQHPEKLIPTVIQSLIKRRPIGLYGSGQNVRDWLHVQDHVRGLWQVLKHGRAGETYNLGANHELTNLSLTQQLCDLWDELENQPAGTSRAQIHFIKDRPGHDWRYALDSSKAKAELQWQAQVPFEQGLRETLLWYRQNQTWVQHVQRLDA